MLCKTSYTLYFTAVDHGVVYKDMMYISMLDDAKLLNTFLLFHTMKKVK